MLATANLPTLLEFSTFLFLFSSMRTDIIAERMHTTPHRIDLKRWKIARSTLLAERHYHHTKSFTLVRKCQSLFFLMRTFHSHRSYLFCVYTFISQLVRSSCKIVLILWVTSIAKTQYLSQYSLGKYKNRLNINSATNTMDSPYLIRTWRERNLVQNISKLENNLLYFNKHTQITYNFWLLTQLYILLKYGT